LLLDLRLARVEVDALEHALEALDLVGELVRAAVLVVEAVVGLGLVLAGVVHVEDPVAVLVGHGAAVGAVAPLLRARVAAVLDAVAVAVAIERTAAVVLAVLLGALVVEVGDGVAVAVGPLGPV